MTFPGVDPAPRASVVVATSLFDDQVCERVRPSASFAEVTRPWESNAYVAAFPRPSVTLVLPAEYAYARSAIAVPGEVALAWTIETTRCEVS